MTCVTSEMNKIIYANETGKIGCFCNSPSGKSKILSQRASAATEQ